MKYIEAHNDVRLSFVVDKMYSSKSGTAKPSHIAIQQTHKRTNGEGEQINNKTLQQ